MSKTNRDFFRFEYPRYWTENRAKIADNSVHSRYQDTSITLLECFDGAKLLECGCGSGDLLARINDRYPNLQLFGVDLGRDTMALAKSSLPSQTVANIHFVEGDITALPMSNNQFDRVLCSSVLWYVPDPLQAIREIIRVLKPGGRFVFDVRNPYHITNALAKLSLTIKGIANKKALSYSYHSPRALEMFLQALSIEFEITGFFILLPTKIPILSKLFRNSVYLPKRISDSRSEGRGRWLAQKLLITGEKL